MKKHVAGQSPQQAPVPAAGPQLASFLHTDMVRAPDAGSLHEDAGGLKAKPRFSDAIADRSLLIQSGRRVIELGPPASN